MGMMCWSSRCWWDRPETAIQMTGTTGHLRRGSPCTSSFILNASAQSWEQAAAFLCPHQAGASARRTCGRALAWQGTGYHSAP